MKLILLISALHATCFQDILNRAKQNHKSTPYIHTYVMMCVSSVTPADGDVFSPLHFIGSRMLVCYDDFSPVIFTCVMVNRGYEFPPWPNIDFSREFVVYSREMWTF